MTIVSNNPDRLYELLPALYRISDADKNFELRALLRLITGHADALRNETQRVWDDFFIETCERWVIPYIGDLIGNNLLHDLDCSAAAATAQSLFTDLAGPDLRPRGAIRVRADVANTIHYRRRKGTPAMLEQLARDVTGWGAHVVEFFTLLDWNQHLEHLRLDCHGCPDIRRVDLGDRVGGPWDSTSHTVDVRRINEFDGWHNIPNIGFFLWRLNAYPLPQTAPRPIGGTSWRFTFDPLGQDIPLFSSGLAASSTSGIAAESNIEAPIRAAAFFEDLDAVPPPPAAPTQATTYYGEAAGTSVVVYSNGKRVLASEVSCQNLSGWTTIAQPGGNVIWIDATRGRLVIPANRAGETITVSFYYGFSADVGGGKYPRRKWLVPSPPPVLVSGGGAALDTAIATRVPVLVSGGTGLPALPHTVITITDDASYDLVNNITLAAGESLTIQADDSVRPLIRLGGGSISILGGGVSGSIGAALTLGGLLIEGGLRVDADLGTLRLLHSTLVPGRSVLQEASVPVSGPSLVVAPGPATALINTGLEVEIAFSIVGALQIPAHITKLWLLDSIVDGIEQNGGPLVSAIADPAGSGPPAHIERSTVFGPSQFHKLEMASETIFSGAVTVEQRQQGCVRFCYVPPGSVTPQQYRCQPALETAREGERMKADAAKTGIPLPFGWEAALASKIAQWLVPTFASTQYGRPDFAQLRLTCPSQIRTGAEDGSEMGVFCVLKQPQREANLRMRLDEYLPAGLEAGVIYVT